MPGLGVGEKEGLFTYSDVKGVGLLLPSLLVPASALNLAVLGPQL